MSKVKDRLIQFIKHLGIGQLKFEESANLARGFVNKVGYSISKKSEEKISETYPELDMNWLKTGIGNMLKGVDDAEYSQTAMGNGNTQISGNGNNITFSSTVERFLNELTAQRELTKEAQQQLTKSQEQMDRLITIIEQLHK
jgi:hypothetical protein